MRRGLLSDLFTGVVAKRLTLVETITHKSNQHEFQGTRPLRRLLGDDDRRGIATRFIWISGEQEAPAEEGFMSWSNVRKGKPRAPEYHLYYSSNAVTELMQPGDMLFLALQQDGSILVVVTPSATIQNQLIWLFALEEQPEFAFTFRRSMAHIMPNSILQRAIFSMSWGSSRRSLKPIGSIASSNASVSTSRKHACFRSLREHRCRRFRLQIIRTSR